MSIEDGGGRVTNEISGDDQVLGIIDDAFERTLGGILDGLLDLVVRCTLF